MSHTSQLERSGAEEFSPITGLRKLANRGVIFRWSLRDNRKAILGMGLGTAALAVFVTVLYPLFSEFEAINQLLESPLLSALLGDVGDYTTPEGFLGSEFFGFMPLFLAFYVVFTGLGITAADEAGGRLDVLLSTPLPRWQLIVEKIAALTVSYFLILVLMFAGFALGLILMPEVEIALSRVGEGVLNLLPIMLVMTALPMLLSTLVRGRGKAGGIAGAIIVASYFIATLSDLAADVLGTVKYLSMFTYFNSFTVLSEGMRWGDVALLLGVAAALFGLSIVLFQRRDLST